MEENKIVPLYKMQVPLSDEEKKTVEDFSAIGYSIEKIASLIEEDYSLIMIDFKNKESDFYKAYSAGILEAKAKVDIAILENAKKGNITAAQRMDKIWEEQKLENLKNEIFNT